MKSLAQISRDLNIPVTTLHQAVKDGRLPAAKIGRDWLVDETSQQFKKFLENYRPREQKK